MATWLKQSTAVDVKMGPFLDNVDGNTAETALTITQPDIRLAKNGGAWAQKNAAQTLTHEEAGWYEVALDTTDTDTLGILIIAIHESGALPVWREFLVVPANVYDSHFSTDKLQVDVAQFGDTNGTFSAGRPEVNTSHAAGTAWGSGAITAAAIAADAITAAKIANGAIDAATFAAGAIDAAAIANGAIDAATFAAGAIDAAAIAADAITAAKIANGAIDAATFAAGAIDAAAIADNAIDAGAIAADAITAAKIATGAIDADSIAAAALNGKGDWNIGKTGYALSGAGVQAIWDALTAALTTASSIGKLLVDNINATVSSRFPTASAPANFSSLGITAGGAVATQANVKKNTALASFEFVMTDSTTHAPKTGVAVTATRSLDGAAFAACANAVSELSNGVYVISLAATDLNANVVTLRFTGAASDDTFITLVTNP